MIDNSGAPDSGLLQQLETAATKAELVSILCIPGSSKVLAKNVKLPCVRKSVMILCADAGNSPVEEYSRTLATLAVLSAEKQLQPLIDEFSPKFLSGRVAEVYQTLSKEERVLVSSWISSKSLSWLTGHAAQWAVQEAADPELCLIHVKTLLTRTADLAAGLNLILGEVQNLDALGQSSDAAPLLTLCRIICDVVAKTDRPLGKSFAYEFSTLIRRGLNTNAQAKPDTARISTALTAATTLSALIGRSPSLLGTDACFSLFATLDGALGGASERKWTKVRKNILQQFIEAAAFVALDGQRPEALLNRIETAGVRKAEMESICRAIVERYDIADEEVAGWVTQRGKARNTSGPATQGGARDDEVIAMILIRADELERTALHEQCSSAHTALEALEVEIRQLALRRSMALDGEPGQIVEHDPLRQTCTGAVQAGDKVVVVSPGVVMTLASGHHVQVRPAIVAPACSKPDREAQE